MEWFKKVVRVRRIESGAIEAGNHGLSPNINCADKKFNGVPRMAETPGGTGSTLGTEKMNIRAPIARSPSAASRSATDTLSRPVSRVRFKSMAERGSPFGKPP